MSISKKEGFATRQIHAGVVDESNRSLCTPIYQTSTFKFSSVEQGGARFAGQEAGYIYSRLGNPTITVVEGKVADLEEGEAACATASGMGAVSATLWSSVVAGDQILADDTLYGCTYTFLNHGMTKFGVEVDQVDMSDLDKFKAAIKPNTKVVYFETPCNPTLKVIDIAEVARIAHEANPEIRVIVDNTFSSPYLQRPLTLGADVVIHSATKYINGHADVIAGFIISDAEFIEKCKMFGIKDMTGAVLSPFDAFLLIRGLKTLDIRMDRHSSNALKVAKFLEGHPAVASVAYPGLESFPGHAVAKKQMSAFGGVLSIELKATKEEVAAAINSLKLVIIAVSLGDPETLIEHPATMTHSICTPEELKEAGISEGLVRISIGLEDPDDLIADFKQAFDKLIK